jgi:protein tyrosine phosphatase (PTP) superfamily phosphohydrolase (DUF442 family)
MRSRILKSLACLVLLATAAATASAAPAASRNAPPTFGIPQATFPRPGLLFAGQPTGEQIQLLAEEGGYHSVIDLRSPDEPRGYDEPEAARLTGLAYFSIPVTAATLDQAAIDRFLAALRAAAPPVIVHGSTADRPAALLYAWLVLEKRESPLQALEHARAAGLRDRELIHKVRMLVAERSGPAAGSHP